MRQDNGASLRDRAGGATPLSHSTVSQPEALIPSAENIEIFRQVFSDGFYACATYYEDDPDSASFGETATQAWGDYAETQLGVCGTPPAGWFCTRRPGHTVPCAAVETRK